MTFFTFLEVLDTYEVQWCTKIMYVTSISSLTKTKPKFPFRHIVISMIRNQRIFFISLFFILYPPRLLIWPVANHNKVEALCSPRVRGWTNWVADNLDNFFWSSNLDVRCPSCHIPPLIICFKGPIKIPLTVNLYSLKFWCCFSPPKCTQITSLVLITLLIT